MEGVDLSKITAREWLNLFSAEGQKRIAIIWEAERLATRWAAGRLNEACATDVLRERVEALEKEVAVRQRLERELVEMEKNLMIAEEKERTLRAHAVTIRQAAEDLVRVASQVERGLVIP